MNTSKGVNVFEVLDTCRQIAPGKVMPVPTTRAASHPTTGSALASGQRASGQHQGPCFLHRVPGWAW